MCKKSTLSTRSPKKEYTSPYCKVFSNTGCQESRNTSSPRIPRDFTDETVGQRHIVQKDFISLSRASCNEESTPTQKSFVGERKNGCARRQAYINLQCSNHLKKFLGNTSNGNQFMHESNRNSFLTNCGHRLVVWNKQRTFLQSVLTGKPPEITMPGHSRRPARTVQQVKGK